MKEWEMRWWRILYTGLADDMMLVFGWFDDKDDDDGR